MKRAKFYFTIFFIIIGLFKSGVAQEEYTVISAEDQIIPQKYSDVIKVVDIQTGIRTPYYGFTQKEPLVFTALGVTNMEMHFILDYPENLFGTQTFEVNLFIDEKSYETFKFETKPDVNAYYYDDTSGKRPSRIETCKFQVPIGYHKISLYLKNAEASSARVNIYQLVEIVEGKEVALQNFVLNFGFLGTYDNNLLRLSDQEIDDFIENYPEKRWIDMTTADDFITIPFVKLDMYQHFPESRASKLSIKFAPRLHSLNSCFNSVDFDLLFQKHLGFSNQLILQDSFVPKRYYGHLLDEQIYRPSRYLQNHFSITFKRKLRNFWVKFNYQNQLRNFNDPFENRNHMEHGVGIGIEKKIFKSANFSLGYHYVQNMATNKDDKIDVSFRAQEFSVGFNRRFFSERLLGGLEYNFVMRDFSSDIEEDELHYQRSDMEHLAGSDFEFRVTRHIYANLRYAFIYNEANLEKEVYQSASAGDWTDFMRHQFTTGITYKF